MIIKFLGTSMKAYAGIDGNGGSVRLEAGESAEVSEQVGKILLTRYGKNFELVIPEESKSEAAPKTDKFYRKAKATQVK